MVIKQVLHSRLSEYFTVTIIRQLSKSKAKIPITTFIPNAVQNWTSRLFSYRPSRLIERGNNFKFTAHWWFFCSLIYCQDQGLWNGVREMSKESWFFMHYSNRQTGSYVYHIHSMEVPLTTIFNRVKRFNFFVLWTYLIAWWEKRVCKVGFEKKISYISCKLEASSLFVYVWWVRV